MPIVTNLIKLILLMVSGLAYFFGIGWVLIYFVIQNKTESLKDNLRLEQIIPLSMVFGIIINYALVLVLHELSITLITGWTLSIIGLGIFGFYLWKNYRFGKPKILTLFKMVGILLFCIAYLSPILMEPLHDWDARSIWFFHAKIIYTGGAIIQPDIWSHDSVVFSHPDYPKLIPAIAAQVSYIQGFWNEYLPKISLFYLLVPGIIWLFSFARRSISFFILILFMPLSFSNLMWNGYMDGLFAFYFTLSMLFLGENFIAFKTTNIIISLSCLFLLVYIKNEGALALLVGLIIVLVNVYINKKNIDFKIIDKQNIPYYVMLLIYVVPIILWEYYKGEWNLTNDLELGTAASILRIQDRIIDGSILTIITKSFEEIYPVLLLTVVVIFLLFIRHQAIPKQSVPPLLAAGLFLIGMVIIYLLTPNDLAWHLSTSIDRTMLSVKGTIIVGFYYLLSSCENYQLTV